MCLQEYNYLQCAVMQLSNLGVSVSTSPVSDCPCCADADELHSINIDFNFSLNHLGQCGTADVRLPPPNSRLFLRHPAVATLLQQANAEGSASAAAQAEADRACSDFDAARIMGRTSDKVGCMQTCRHCSCFLAPVMPKPAWFQGNC